MTLYDHGRAKGRQDVLEMLDPTERPLIEACLGPVAPVYVCSKCEDTGSFYDGLEMAPCSCLAGTTKHGRMTI